MLANLSVEIILLICEYPELKDLGQLAWTTKRMMQIIKKYLPIALERKHLFYLSYTNNDVREGRICLFDSHNVSVGYIVKFTNYLKSYEVATTKDKIFALNRKEKLFEIFNRDARETTRGPDPPEWRKWASVVYFKGKLYYLGGTDPKTGKDTNRVDVLIDGKWQTGPSFPLSIEQAQTVTCDEILYVFDGGTSRKIYRLSGDKREWTQIGETEIPERRLFSRIASLNGRIYITGGRNNGDDLKSCLYFDPSAPVGSRISQIADMNYARYNHSLVAANSKLYAIGGYQKDSFSWENLCNSIEEYDSQTNKWRKVGKVDIT